MSTILDEIIAHTRADLVTARQMVPPALIREHVATAPPARDFAAALRRGADGAARIIAELKRASPSKGLIRPNFGVVSLACELEEHGAAALSVLTEVRYFRGSPEFLRAVVANVAIPVLRKDFVVDPYQVYEARAWGASAVLLIVAALTPDQFVALHRLAGDIGLAVLTEVHDADELKLALDAGARVVGVNSRDLRSFKTDLGLAADLLRAIPPSVVRVAESGIRTAADLGPLLAAGADAVLVGEALMRAPSPGLLLDDLLTVRAPAAGPRHGPV